MGTMSRWGTMGLDHVRERVERLVAPLLLPKEDEEIDTSLIYRPLQHRQIRIIALAPGKWDDEIECSLSTVSLDDNPSYETLSYVWGDPKLQKKTILLQRQRFQVTPSLESALRHLRHEETERTMWVDAVCINQRDDVEKSVHVKQMQLIYARTSHLIIWVGEANGDSDLGMETVKQVGGELKGGTHWDVDLADVSLIKSVMSEKKAFDPKPWVAANRLLRRDWFERVWVTSLSMAIGKARC